MRNDRFLLLCFAAVLLLLGIAVLVLFFAKRLDLFVETVASLTVSLLLIVVSYSVSRRAFDRSTAQFYRLIFGGMAGRFLFFMAALFIVFKWTDWSLAGFVISFAMFYAVLQILEIMFITRQLRQKSRA
mgnify:CR=1 FL=1